MNTEVLTKAMEMDEFNNDLPQVEIGEVVEMSKIWDGEGEVPETSYSYQLTDMDWINYRFEVIEEKENCLDTLIKITAIELL